MTVAIVTAVFGNYDELKPVCDQSIECEWICVTDDDDLDAQGWRVVYEPRLDVPPRLAAKPPKCCPERYTDAAQVIWVDAAFRVLSPRFAEEALAFLDHDLAQWKHPDRDCVYDEAAVSMTMARHDGMPIGAACEKWRAQGHPEHWGLWACGVIVRDQNPRTIAFGEAWLDECQTMNADQCSQAPLLRKHGLRPDPLPPAYYYGAPWLAHEMSPQHFA